LIKGEWEILLNTTAWGRRWPTDGFWETAWRTSDAGTILKDIVDHEM